MIYNKRDYEMLLDFIYELQQGYSNFPHHVLNLFSKYFNYDYLTFFPVYENNTYIINDVDKRYFTKYISKNFESTTLREYNEYYYKKDYFQPVNLPRKLLDKHIVTINDIMPYEKFKLTEYYQLMEKYHLHYGLCIYMNLNNITLGAIGVYRSKEKGDFNSKELKTLDSLYSFLSQNYKLSIDISMMNKKQLILKNCCEQLPFGTILLDSQLSLIDYSNTAYEYCREIIESKKLCPGRTVLCKFSSTDPVLGYIRNVVDYVFSIVAENIFNKEVAISTDNCNYNFTLSSFYISSSLGSIETIYFIYVSKQFSEIKSISPEFNFTKRELDILELIIKGCSNNEISKTLYISKHTVKTHIMNIFKKANVSSRSALIYKIKNT